jgi:hypothetical protein
MFALVLNFKGFNPWSLDLAALRPLARQYLMTEAHGKGKLLNS